MPRLANFSPPSSRRSPFALKSSVIPTGAGQFSLAAALPDRWPARWRSHSSFLPFATTFAALVLSFFLCGCSQPSHDPSTLNFLIESSPTTLDPRFATDSQAQRINALLFSGLVSRDENMIFHGDLADSWETPNNTTYIFHLHPSVRFHDGRPLTSADVKSTFDFILNPQNASPKRGAFRLVTSVDAPEPATVVFHLSEPYASFLTNLMSLNAGIVPANAPADFAQHPVGSGSFQFVRQSQDDEVILERNSGYFKTPPQLSSVRFRVVPDAVVRALELGKGSADLETTSLSPDIIPALLRQSSLALTQRPGTNLAYLGINLEDSSLSKQQLRQALALATDRESIIKYLLRGYARPASGVLPPNHWAFEQNVAQYPYDPAHAEDLLDAAGFPRASSGVRLHLTLKCSTDEQARLIGAALQEQWRKIGIDLELRPLELATLLADVARGSFQLTYLRWVGANNDPDAFEFFFSSKRFPPNGANRGHYRSAKMDALTDQIRVEMNQEKRKELCSEAQKLFADDLPYIPLWFTDVVSIHSRAIGEPALSPTGDYDFLTTLHPTSVR